MWSPEPQQHWAVAIDRGPKRGDGTVGHRQNLDVSNVVRRRQQGSVPFRRLCGGDVGRRFEVVSRCAIPTWRSVGGGAVTGSAGGEEEHTGQRQGAPPRTKVGNLHSHVTGDRPRLFTGNPSIVEIAGQRLIWPTAEAGWKRAINRRSSTMARRYSSQSGWGPPVTAS